VNQEIHWLHFKAQMSFDTRMIHSGMVKGAKISAAITLTTAHLLGSVLCCLVTTSDGIEVRICSRQATNNEDTPIGLLEIYVQ
jgi:uncharacterized membrane protein